MRLIDAEEFQTIINRVFPCNNCEDANIRRAMELGLKECHTVDAIVIPKDATNQDVAKIVFGNQVEELFPSGDTLIVERFMPYCKAQLNKDWLDMPYIKNYMED